MTTDKVIHFGYFVRAKHLSEGVRLKEFSFEVGMSTRRMLQIQRGAQSMDDVPEGTAYRIAKALNLPIEQLRHDAETIPVPVPRFKRSVKGQPAIDLSSVAENGDVSGRPLNRRSPAAAPRRGPAKKPKSNRRS